MSKTKNIAVVYGGLSPIYYLDKMTKAGITSGKIYSDSTQEKKILDSLYSISPYKVPAELNADVLFSTPVTKEQLMDVVIRTEKIELVVIDLTNLPINKEIKGILSQTDREQYYVDITPDKSMVPQDKTYSFVLITKEIKDWDLNIDFNPERKTTIASILSTSVPDKYYLSDGTKAKIIGDKTDGLNRLVCKPIRRNLAKHGSINTDNYYSDERGVRTMTEVEVGRVLGYNFSDNQVFGIGKNDAYKIIATSTPVPIVEALFEAISKDGESFISKETYMFKGKRYLYDGVLSVTPSFRSQNTYAVVMNKNKYSFSSKEATPCITNRGRKIVFIHNRESKLVRQYIDDNMASLAVRDWLDGRKWFEVIEA